MLKKFLWLYSLCISSYLMAQDTNKIQTFRIYSGEYCMFPHQKNFVACSDTTSYRLTTNQIQPIRHISELVMFENKEFWWIQNSMYPHHKDSLLFFTGTWKADDALFKLYFDSISKPLRYFKKVAYRPKYFNKPIIRNYYALDTFKKVRVFTAHIIPYDLSLGVYSNDYRCIHYNDDSCSVIIPKCAQIYSRSDTLEITWSIFGDYGKFNYDLEPVIKIPLIYSQPIKIRQRN